MKVAEKRWKGKKKAHIKGHEGKPLTVKKKKGFSTLPPY